MSKFKTTITLILTFLFIPTLYATPSLIGQTQNQIGKFNIIEQHWQDGENS